TETTAILPPPTSTTVPKVVDAYTDLQIAHDSAIKFNLTRLIMTQNIPNSEMKEFFDRIRFKIMETGKQKKISIDPGALRKFFNHLSKHNLRPAETPINKPDGLPLSLFFEKLKDPLHKSIRRGSLCNPWSISGIKRDERANVGILAWLLDPSGDHGLGGIFLQSFLNLVNLHSKKKFSLLGDSKIFVGTEHQCDENGTPKRIDVIIKNYSEINPFVIGIEAKIDSTEQPCQTQTYLNSIRILSSGNPYHLVYLTATGEQANVEFTQLGNTTAMTWKKLSYNLMRTIRRLEKQPSDCNFSLRLSELFLKHTLTF
ncbi:PD-(D/E)XK nuclease family protein, partial [Candidatus Igneacidithiobacillus taiwanensis]